MIHQGFLKARILVIFFIGVSFFFVILLRAFQLQLLPNRKLKDLAGHQYRAQLTLLSKRGTIYDRNFVELALSRKVGSIFANPKTIKNRKKVATVLSRMTGISSSNILKKLNPKKSFVWIRRLVDDSVTQRIQKNPVNGVGIVYEYERFYPQQDLAGQVLGRTGVDSEGIEGLEYAYDAVLQGQKKSISVLRDARGRIVTLDEMLAMESQEGSALVLTIDKNLQFLAERELSAQIEKMGARQGLAIIQNARSGEILAMAHAPFFNPNHSLNPKAENWKNRAVTEVFEPGSTYKVFLAASALTQGISPNERFYCEDGLFRLNSKDAIREAQRHKYQWLTFSDVIKFSSNIGAAKIGLQIGRNALFTTTSDFGFGQKTGIDLPGEVSGLLQPKDKWSKVELSNISFGQGISVTAIQLVSAMSAIANGGKWMKPYVVQKRINQVTSEVQETKPTEVRMILSQEILKRLTKMLVSTTEKDGTGFLAALSEYPVAGKTGTAQKINYEKATYFKDKHLTSFLGFFPANAKDNEPIYTIFVSIDEPKKIPYASYVSAPVFKLLAEHTSRLYPSESKIVKTEQIPQSIESADLKNSSDPRQTPFELDIMPDLKGKSMREVLSFAEQAGLIIKTRGSGIGIDQSIKAGSKITKGKVCVVTFESPMNAKKKIR